jgi:small subunit ribosomal protein S17
MTEQNEQTENEQAPEAEEAEPAAAAPAAEQSAPAAAEPDEQLSPKERRRRSRSTHTGEVLPQRSAEERASERAAERERKARNRRRYRQRTRERRAAEGPRAATPTPPEPETAGGKQKVRQGVVVSDKADKTIIVRIDVARRHRMYKKIVRTSSTLHVHDENNEAHIGDTVQVIESRPLSRTKRWRLTDVLERAR